MAKKNSADTGGMNEMVNTNETVESPIQDSVTENSNNGEQAVEATNATPVSKKKATAKGAQKKKSVKAETATPKPAAIKQAKNKAGTIDKKVKLVSSCYHYYRNVLRNWLREHKVPSARFLKNPENYDGYITVLESEKAQAVKALAQYRKENPDVKDLWKEMKK